jgi:hypothetical protein
MGPMKIWPEWISKSLDWLVGGAVFLFGWGLIIYNGYKFFAVDGQVIWDIAGVMMGMGCTGWGFNFVFGLK